MKLLGIRYASVVVIFLVTHFIMSQLFANTESNLNSIIPMVLAIFTSPRLKKIQTPIGNEYHLSILFTDKIIK